jgi:hypothetical protein
MCFGAVVWVFVIQVRAGLVRAGDWRRSVVRKYVLLGREGVGGRA